MQMLLCGKKTIILTGNYIRWPRRSHNTIHRQCFLSCGTSSEWYESWSWLQRAGIRNMIIEWLYFRSSPKKKSTYFFTNMNYTLSCRNGGYVVSSDNWHLPWKSFFFAFAFAFALNEENCSILYLGILRGKNKD